MSRTKRHEGLRKVGPLLALLCLVGCESGSTGARAPGGAARAGGDTEGAAGGECRRRAEPVAVTLRTDDGVALAADYYPGGRRGGPGVVLLHMIPPHWTHKSYPSDFIFALVEGGFSVVNVNRRGAPGSEGVAEEAYRGDSGWLDAKAGRDWLVAAGCAVPSEAVAMIGASNGTTTVLDYALRAARTGGIDPPAAMVLLSGGRYTEAQQSLEEALGVLGGVPALVAYPAAEREWNERARGLARGAGGDWRFVELDPGDHGTKLFASDPEIAGRIVGFLGGVVGTATRSPAPHSSRAPDRR